MNLWRIGAVLLALFLFVVGSVNAQEAGTNGLVTVQSAYTADETVSRLQTALADRGLTVVTTVNHTANAQNVEQELAPTQVILFGNPNLGTPLMQNQQTNGIDLPQKFLVWEDANGVNVTYNDPQYLADRHGLTEQDEVLSTISTALANFADGVTTAETPAESDEATDTPAESETDASTETDQADDAPASLPNTSGTNTILPWLLGAALLLLASGSTLWRIARRYTNTTRFLLIALLAGSVVTQLAPVATQAQSTNGLVTVDSPYTVEETVTRLEAGISERELTLVTKLDHTANAQSVDLELRPTQLLVFGNPNVGTPLMQSQQTIGIDLPQKMLVWEDADGQVRVTYNDPQYLADRHSITDQGELVSRVTNVLNELATTATAE
ncbi:MAG: DUF302 domain-containing protein [Chloroflexota bacterium]